MRSPRERYASNGRVARKDSQCLAMQHGARGIVEQARGQGNGKGVPTFERLRVGEDRFDQRSKAYESVMPDVLEPNTKAADRGIRRRRIHAEMTLTALPSGVARFIQRLLTRADSFITKAFVKRVDAGAENGTKDQVFELNAVLRDVVEHGVGHDAGIRTNGDMRADLNQRAERAIGQASHLSSGDPMKMPDRECFAGPRLGKQLYKARFRQSKIRRHQPARMLQA